MSQFYSYNAAKTKARKLKLSSNLKWRNYCRSPNFDIKFPKAPDNYYRNNGWSNWFDFLGNSTDRRTYCVNDNFFSKWSYNMSYIFGLWFADGHIRKGTIANSYLFSIKQHKQDNYIFHMILKEMKCNHLVHKDKNSNCSYIAITSPKIFIDIIKLGGKPRKSLDAKFPKIPQKYLPDFIRGYFDGDGTVDKKCCFYSGSKKFVVGLKRVLEKNIGGFKSILRYYVSKKGQKFWRNGKLVSYKKDCIVYRLNISTNSSRKLRDFMYRGKKWDKDKFKIIRKWQKFVNMGGIRPRSGDVKYLSFTKLRKIVKKNGFHNASEYRKWVQDPKCKIIAPAHPDVVYQGKWQKWHNFLGNEKMSYKQLKKMVIKNKIKTRK